MGATGTVAPTHELWVSPHPSFVAFVQLTWLLFSYLIGNTAAKQAAPWKYVCVLVEHMFVLEVCVE